MIDLYTMDGCLRCHEVKTYLVAHSIPFVEKNILEEHRFVVELIRLNGEVVTPALVENGHVYTHGALEEHLKGNRIQK